MPAKSKSQQRFFGVVKAMQKGDIPKKGKAGKIAKQMSKGDVDDFASTKHKGKPEKVKKEQRVKNLIKKMVREILDEDFAGTYPKGMRKKFDNNRKKQSEVLGYKLTGKDDIKVEIDDATIKEQKLNEKVQRYVVGLENGEVLSGDKSVTEKRALQIMSRISKRSDGWVNPFMIGVEAWNGTHEKSKGKPHKLNKKKITVKEGKLTEGRPRGYAEEIAQDLVKKKKVKKGMKENKLIDAIFKWLKRNDRNKNRVRWLMSYDEDFLSDTISAINNYLKEEKLTEKKYDTIMKGDKVKVIGKYIDSKYRGKKGKVIDMGINGNNYMIKIGSTKMILFPDDIVKEGKLTEGKGVDKVLSMANDNSFGKLGGKTVDAMSANLFKTVYDKLTGSNKEKIDKMNEKQLYVFMTKLWTKFGKQVRI